MRKAFILDNEDGDKLQVMELGEHVMVSIKRADHEMGTILSRDQWQDFCDLRYKVHFDIPSTEEI